MHIKHCFPKEKAAYSWQNFAGPTFYNSFRQTTTTEQPLLLLKRCRESIHAAT